jgi:DNA-binding NarL/FixJ family response regulator
MRLRITEARRPDSWAQSSVMRRRLMIVDDNLVFRHFARGLLECEGWEVVCAVHDGRAALATARELAPDVVLLDVDLPDASGFSLAQRLLHELPDVAVLITSARDYDCYEQLARQSGARGFVPKGALSGAELDRRLTVPSRGSDGRDQERLEPPSMQIGEDCRV